jgi:alanyl-tRNA synthetase
VFVADTCPQNLPGKVDDRISPCGVLLQEAARLHGSGVSRAVFVVPVGSDSRAIKQVTETIKSVAPSLSFLCISAEEDKVTAFAHCTDAAQQGGLRANAWVTAVMAEVGGKGGGRPASAQGSAAIATGQDLHNAVEKLKRAAEQNTVLSKL